MTSIIWNSQRVLSTFHSKRKFIFHLFVFSDALEQFRVERLQASFLFWLNIIEIFKEHFRSMLETSDSCLSENDAKNIM